MNWKTALNNSLLHIVQNPKTTISSVLTVLIAMGVYCSLTPTNLISQTHAQDLTFITGGLKVLLGLIQKDAKQ